MKVICQNIINSAVVATLVARIVVVTSVAFLSVAATAEVLRVPSDDYPTIQSAIDGAFAGDQIVIAAGEYPEDLTMTVGVELVAAGQEMTTIIGRLNVTSPIGPPPAIGDFTITNGVYFTSSGGSLSNVTVQNAAQDGINCSSSSPTITNVTITGAAANGINCSSSSPNITNVTITGPATNGIVCGDSSPTIDNVTITGAKAYGLYLWNASSPKIRRSIITQSGSDGVITTNGFGNGRSVRGSSPNFGTAGDASRRIEADPGNNEIFRNRGFNVNHTLCCLT